ncbi:MAG: permease [Chthoniobacteraceae bacterium]
MNWFHLQSGDFAKAFLSVLFEGVPFLLLGALISGFVDVFVSAERFTKLLPSRPGPAIFLAGVLGLIFPMCECGSVIIVRRFIRKGMPLGVATCYMLAAPIVSPIVALSTFKAFTGQNPWLMLCLRLGFGYAIAVLVGLIVHQLPRRVVAQPSPADVPVRRRTGLSISSQSTAESVPADFTQIVATASPLRKVMLAIQSATSDFMDVTVFFVIGTAITSAFAVGVNREVIAPLAQSPFLSVVSLMILAALLGLCSTTDAFVAATQLTIFPPAAKLAFLLFGPVFDLKRFWLYGLVFRRRFVVLMALGLFALIAFICWIWAGVEVGGMK